MQVAAAIRNLRAEIDTAQVSHNLKEIGGTTAAPPI
jgi:hypothetical protein